MSGIDTSRTTALLGASSVSRLQAAKVAVIGVGGVGSWCAEALVRTGVGRIVLVDDDVVAASNVNRQCPATSLTVGRRKVEVMAERLREINPSCEVEARFERFESFAGYEDFDLIVDAIDSVDCKAELILGATMAGVPLVSSMGAARRIDPTRVVACPFDKVAGDGLARALRQRFKRLGRYPSRRFTCVCSTEAPMSSDVPGEKGSVMPVTCAFGMALASSGMQLLLSHSQLRT